MSTTRRYELGAYVANEESLVMHAPGWSGGGPVVLVCPGVAAGAWAYEPSSTSDPRWWQGFTLLAEAGAILCFGTFADGPDGGSSWGNQPGRDRMDLALAMLDTDYGADVSRVGIIGDSEGGDLGLNYGWRHTDAVQAIVTRLSPPWVQHLYDENGLVQALIDTAFDSLGGWAANAETHDPWSDTNRALVSAISDRVRMYYSEDDGLALAAHHVEYAAATGVQVQSVGAVAHDIATTGAVDPHLMARFIWERIG